MSTRFTCAWVAAALCVGALCTSCVSSISGTAKPAEHHRIPGIEQILPTLEETNADVGSQLEPNGPPSVGGSDKLAADLKDNADIAPIECLGPVQPRERVVYQQAPVKAVAIQEYWNHQRAPGGVLVVRAAAIELASEPAARKFFETSVQQWKQCDGRTAVITKEDRIHVMWNVKVGDVAVSGPLLTATNRWWDEPPKPAFPDGRALGIAANVIVDVDVTMDPDYGTPAPVGDRATKVANEMLRKVTTTY